MDGQPADFDATRRATNSDASEQARDRERLMGMRELGEQAGFMSWDASRRQMAHEAMEARRRDREAEDARARRQGGLSQRRANLDGLARARSQPAAALAAHEEEVAHLNDPRFKRHHKDGDDESDENAEDEAENENEQLQRAYGEQIVGVCLRSRQARRHKNDFSNTRILVQPKSETSIGQANRDPAQWLLATEVKRAREQYFDHIWGDFVAKHVHDGFDFENYTFDRPFFALPHARG
jgi:hypothetical protein